MDFMTTLLIIISTVSICFGVYGITCEIKANKMLKFSKDLIQAAGVVSQTTVEIIKHYDEKKGEKANESKGTKDEN